MDLLHSIVLGFVQGFTEFLPISSSGHLHLVQIGLGIVPDLAFEVWLHLATLLAVLVLFWKDVWNLILGFVALFGIGKGTRENGMLALKLGVATLITFAGALVLEPYFDSFLTLGVVGGTLILTGFFILASEEFRPKVEKHLTWGFTILLGLAQTLALFPGISRSGITIACLVLLGIGRKDSARFSFLLSIPTILGAFVYTFIDDGYELAFSYPLIVSGVVAFISALFAMKWMMKLIEGKWKWFSVYCFLVGVGVLMVGYLL